MEDRSKLVVFWNDTRTKKIRRVSDTGSWSDSIWELLVLIDGTWERAAMGCGKDPRNDIGFYT
jgi:hypothetical protein